jgi:flavorubredoxin
MADAVSTGEGLPRELAPGLLWLGSCLENPYLGSILHTYTSAFLVSGSDASVLVDPGLTGDPTILERQLANALRDAAPLAYVFLTHQETPHAGGLGRILDQYPDVVAVGDIRDYHLLFPRFVERFAPLEVGESLDLGGNEFVVVEAVIRDLPTTRWGFASEQGVLFSSDGFAYAHHHQVGQCGKYAEEVPELDITELAGIFYHFALPWIQITDMEPYIDRLVELIDGLGVRIIAPEHGPPIMDLPATLPRAFAALREASTQPVT